MNFFYFVFYFGISLLGFKEYIVDKEIMGGGVKDKNWSRRMEEKEEWKFCLSFVCLFIYLELLKR